MDAAKRHKLSSRTPQGSVSGGQNHRSRAHGSQETVAPPSWLQGPPGKPGSSRVKHMGFRGQPHPTPTLWEGLNSFVGWIQRVQVTEPTGRVL